MARDVLSEAAEAELDALVQHTADVFGVEQALRLHTQLSDLFDKLAGMPNMGRARPELTDRPYLFFPRPPVLIAYLPDSEPLAIAHVIGAGEDAVRKLAQR